MTLHSQHRCPISSHPQTETPWEKTHQVKVHCRKRSPVEAQKKKHHDSSTHSWVAMETHFFLSDRTKKINYPSHCYNVYNLTMYSCLHTGYELLDDLIKTGPRLISRCRGNIFPMTHTQNAHIHFVYSNCQFGAIWPV